MTALTPERIKELRSFERKLLVESPARRVVAEAATSMPTLKPGAMPRTDLGWLSFKDPSAPASPQISSAEAAVAGDQADQAVVRVEPVGRTRRLRLGDDPDGPTLIRVTKKAYPEWSNARIAEELGVDEWKVELVLAEAARGASLGTTYDSGWQVRGPWLVRVVVGEPQGR